MRRLAGGDYGHPTGVRCPRAGCGGEVVYNGNYFCEHWVWRGDPARDLERGECDWALGNVDPTDPDEPTPTWHDRRVWAKLRRTYPPLVAYPRRHHEEDR